MNNLPLASIEASPTMLGLDLNKINANLAQSVVITVRVQTAGNEASGTMRIVQAVTTARTVELEINWMDWEPNRGLEGLVARILGMDGEKCFQRFHCTTYDPTDQEIEDGAPLEWEHSRRDVQVYVDENGCWLAWPEALGLSRVDGVLAELEVTAVLVDGMAMPEMEVPAGLEGGREDGVLTINIPWYRAVGPGRFAVIRAMSNA